MPFRWLAADARVDRGCKAKQRRRDKTAPTCGSYFYSSTGFGRRPERARKNNFGNHGGALLWDFFPEYRPSMLSHLTSSHRGEHYSPHVTIGVGTVEYLNALLAAPFPTFTFSGVGMSAYQFGNFGTAAKQLHSFKLTQ